MLSSEKKGRIHSNYFFLIFLFQFSRETINSWNSKSVQFLSSFGKNYLLAIKWVHEMRRYCLVKLKTFFWSFLLSFPSWTFLSFAIVLNEFIRGQGLLRGIFFLLIHFDAGVTFKKSWKNFNLFTFEIEILFKVWFWKRQMVLFWLADNAIKMWILDLSEQQKLKTFDTLLVENFEPKSREWIKMWSKL